MTGQYLTRGFDYVKMIGYKLGDLSGFATLAYELVQNADDVPGVTSMSFDLRDKALVVDNDGLFTDCHAIQDPECPWRSTGIGHRCDFHRFRLVASGDKRDEADTTGAFGIGFIAVYQVTDHPELISAGRHWIISDDELEDRRIRQCGGCATCQDSGLPNTRFILPWAVDGDSRLRKDLRTEAVSDVDRARLLLELERSLPLAMIFLKRLDHIEIRRNGVPVRVLDRLREGDDVLVADQEKNHAWHLLRGNFDRRAAALRLAHVGRIEPQRRSDVVVAVPREPLESGLLFAFLPTQHETGLPVHVNADFFPSSDRKKLIFGSDYQAEWNRAALLGAAQALRDGLPRLPSVLRHKRLWRLILSTFQAAQQATRTERSFGDFWTVMLPLLPGAPLMFTTRGEWRPPRGTMVLRDEVEEEAIGVLEALGIPIVHQDLRPDVLQLPYTEVLGVERLSVGHIVKALRNMGLTARVERSLAPDIFKTSDGLESLWSELALLLGRASRTDRAKLTQELGTCAIAVGRDEALWPCNQVYVADSETVALFTSIDPQFPFLADVGNGLGLLKELCPCFGAATAITLMKNTSQARKPSPATLPVPDLPRLFKWIESRREEIVSSQVVKNELVGLPIFPTSDGLRPLTDLVLPGNFVDHLGLAELVDLNRMGGRREFLLDLGAKELTFPVYARDHVPLAFQAGSTIEPERKRAAVTLLASRLGEIRDDEPARERLTSIPIIECRDGVFRTPGNSYFSEPAITAVLGDGINIAVMSGDHADAVRELYRWLGVADKPRPQDIVRKARALVAGHPTAEAVAAVQSILVHLGERAKKNNFETAGFVELQSMTWLPARNDPPGRPRRWHLPKDLYAAYQYHLFESQALFLDLPHEAQELGRDMLRFLGVNSTPTVVQVVRHLLACARDGKEVNRDVYTFLNNNAEDQAVTMLKDQECLLLPTGKYVSPDQVFWTSNPFGRFRYRLGEELWKFRSLFSRLEVRDTPDATDAERVLLEISAEYGNRPLDEDTMAVVHVCWQLLDQALDTEAVTTEHLRSLQGRKVIPNADGVLTPPEWLFFEDRAGLAAKFEAFLQKNVIPRRENAWRAMVVAGVRILSSAVSSRLVELADPVEDTDLSQRLRDRRLQFARVLESQGSANGSMGGSHSLEDLRILRVRELTVGFALHAFNQTNHSQSESVAAHFLRDEMVLYYALRDGGCPWATLARELALALRPEVEPGRLAAGIKEVLTAESDQAARAILDELGYAPLKEAEETPPTTEGYLVDLGGKTAPVLPPPADTLTTGSANTEDEESQDSGEDGKVDSVDGKSDLTTEEAVRKLLGTDGPQVRPMPGEPDGPEGGRVSTSGEVGAGNGTSGGSRSGEDGTGGTKRTAGKSAAGDRSSAAGQSRSQGRLRTYVVHGDGDDARERTGLSERRDAVEQAGIERVLEYERSAGRCPVEMPVHHPGYDVESRDAAGEVVRYIEVKALSGYWGTRGADVTRTEFDKARGLGDRYWLYVVERAQQTDCQIWRIQDPGRRVEEFIYDNGWQELAEVDKDGLRLDAVG